MNRIILATILLITVGIGFSNCGKNNGTVAAPNGVAAKINGVSYLSTSATVRSVLDSVNNPELIITGTATNGGKLESITLYLQNYKGTGTYIISPIWSKGTYSYGAAEHVSQTGKIVVTNSSGTFIQGNFYFQAEDSTYNVTAGTFNTKF
jgi:Family of unknown function (DUF6252)